MQTSKVIFSYSDTRATKDKKDALTDVRAADFAEAEYQGQEGGKAAGLRRCESLGLRVPPFFVVPTSAFSRHLQAGAIPAAIGKIMLELEDLPEAELDRVSAVRSASEHLTSAILHEPVHAAVRDLVQARIEPISPGPWAVRSSMVGEDSTRHSFAGQLASYLYQDDVDTLITSIRLCWASTFSERALAYGLRIGLFPTRAKTAVIVQQMVDADTAGVAFSVNPTSGRRDECLITACWGAGEGVVSGRVDADEYAWSPGDGEREIKVPHKAVRLGRRLGGGTIEYPIDESLRTQRTLSQSEVRAVALATLQISTDMGIAADVEWCLRDGDLYIVQARPVTAALLVHDPLARELVFDNSNIQESFNGVTTPLTFSFASGAYERVFTDYAHVFGVSHKELVGFASSARTLLAFVEGRVYYNLKSWYAMMRLFPGYEQNKEETEKVMWYLDGTVEDDSDDVRSLFDRLRLVRVGAQMAFRILTVDREIQRFKTRFQNFYQSVDRASIADASLSELHATVDRLNRELRDHWEAPNINDFRVMLFCGRLRRITSKIGGEISATGLADLLSGIEGIESLQPTKLLMHLAAHLQQDSRLREALAKDSPQAALSALRAESAEVSRQLDNYLERYGDRCVGELKLETVSLRDQPSFLVQVLRNYVKDDISKRVEFAQVSGERCENAIRSMRKLLPLWQRSSLTWNVRLARRSVAAREELRLFRTVAFGVARDVYRAMGNRLHEAGVLDHPQDIYYLTVDELSAFHEGRSVSVDLAGITRVRRLERLRNEHSEAPNRFSALGSPYLSFSPSVEGRSEGADDDSTVLRGLGCCPGVVTAPVRIITDLSAELPISGEIICAVRTDPGWAPLFPSASGLIVERGSTLSHSAVLARELGLPTVVGVMGATRVLDQGEAVQLDGQAGTVKRLRF